jgi:hypothetical protein
MQVAFATLHCAGIEALDSPQELAALLGCSRSAEGRLDMFEGRVRAHVAPEFVRFWDENLVTIEAGILQCGGTERLWAAWRAALPTTDVNERTWSVLTLASGTTYALAPLCNGYASLQRFLHRHVQCCT